MSFIVMATRSGLSRFGAASAPCKSDGNVLEFETLAEASRTAADYNRRCVSRNIFYTAEEKQ